MAAVYEFDDQPGAVRDALVAGQGWQRDTLLRLVQSACEAGQLPADTDAVTQVRTCASSWLRETSSMRSRAGTLTAPAPAITAWAIFAAS